MRRYALRDDQWDRIKDALPGREGGAVRNVVGISGGAISGNVKAI